VAPPHLAEVCREWRQEIFSTRSWQIDNSVPINPGEAGGFRVRAAGFAQSAYLKPIRVCDPQSPRAANEKIVSDIGFELRLNVPPVQLYRRTDALIGQETRCCVSLVMYSEHHEWQLIWNLDRFPEPVKLIVTEALSRYSKTYALDLLIGQTDRNNGRNVVLGADASVPAHTEFLFLDHAFALNHGGRWNNEGWRNIEMVQIPDVFRRSLLKGLVIEGADELSALNDETIRGIVERIPEDYMDAAHRNTVIAGLNGRKQLLRNFIERNL
jgi:hypothetical protein